MPSTYSNLKIELMATGENDATWGTITNVNLGTALEEAIAGSADVTFASADVTLTLTDTNATQTARHMRLRCTGTTGGATRNLNVPAIEKLYIVRNDCANNIVVKTVSGTGVTVPAGRSMFVYVDGTNVVDVDNHLTSLTLGTPLDITQGGTGATSASAARTALGATTVGSNLFTLANPSAVTFLRLNADNTVNALSAADFRSAIGAGTGTVTSVALSGGSTGFTFSNSPVTGSGTMTMSGTLSVANGGTGVTTLTGVVIGNGTSAFTSKTNPSGAFVGDTDTQNLTNKTLTTGNTINAGTTISDTGTIAANSPGFRGIPQNAQSSTYTLALTDAGKHISITTGGVAIPANGTTAFPIGTTIVVYNNSGSSQNITITSDTLRLAGTATSGSPRVLAQRGIATLIKVNTTEWVVTGNVT